MSAHTPCGCGPMHKAGDWETIRFCKLHEAAPELLEALKAVLTIGQKLGPDYFSVAHDLIRRRAHAAILKASGKP